MPYDTRTRDLTALYDPASYTETSVAGVRTVLSSNNDRGVGRNKGTQTTFSYRGNTEKDYAKMTGPELRRAMLNAHASEYDTGHPFYTHKLEFDYPLRLAEVSTKYKSGSVQSGKYSLNYRGPLYPTWVTSSRPGVNLASSTLLDKWGREAIAATVPTAPQAGLLAMAVEAREGLPRLVGMQLAASRRSAGQLARASGSEYLNVEFGFKPLVNDIAKMAVAVLKFSENLEKHQKGSGQITRARASLEVERTNELVSMMEPATIAMSRANSSSKEDQFFGTTTTATVALHKEFSRSVWFSGAYTYYLDAGENFNGKMKRYTQLAEVLLGGSLTPEVVWQVTPWSWLVDWFSDMDVFMTNVTALRDDSTVLRYGYLMCQTHERWTKRVSGITPRETSTFPTYLQSAWTRTTKQRQQATPYGFGLDLNSFSNRRWSILGSLGMTKAPGQLRRP